MTTIYNSLKTHLKLENFREYKRAEIIYREGDRPDQVWLVEQGMVGLFHVTEAGRETFLRVFGQGYLLGHRSTIAGESFHASAVALTNTRLVGLSTKKFFEIIAQDSDLLLNITRVLARDLRQAEERMAGIVDKTAPQRIIEALLYLRLRHPTQAWTRKEIAEFSASTMETVTRVMTTLEENALITKDKRRFDIPDPQKLIEWHYQS